LKKMLEKMLNDVGITINGNNPWDIKVHDNRFWNRLIQEQSIGAGESYMDGWWDCDRLDEMFYRICRKQVQSNFYSKWKIGLIAGKNAIFNQQSRAKADEVAKTHYNLGNHLYEKMLGKSMAYTCAYWKNANSLDEAQFAKYDLICKKLYLQPNDKVLELGCGWGGLAKYMAENYGCEVVGFDIGSEPAAYAKAHCKGLPVTIYQCDYRDTHIYNPNSTKFNKLVSVGVLEHIGYKNYQMFLDVSKSFMKDEALFLLHSIGGNVSKNYCDPWINKYVFPNGMLPSIKQLGNDFERKLIVEDLQNIGANYEKTLLGWHKNLNDNWLDLKDSFDERFKRMMNYYLLSCAGSFKAREMQLWQFVLTSGKINGYDSIRT
jgi:cyclopropane-fatty-acyl-phospholipid synthase